MSAAIITLAMLKSAGACKDGLALCKATFGNSVIVTRESMTLAAEAGIDIEWGALHLLRGPFLESYNAAMAEPRKAYVAAMAEPLKAYDAATAEPRKAYVAAMAEPLKAYDAATAEPRKAYRAATAEPRKAYVAAMAEAFADAFIAQSRAEVAA
jgi:hypothetical protein